MSLGVRLVYFTVICVLLGPDHWLHCRVAAHRAVARWRVSVRMAVAGLAARRPRPRSSSCTAGWWRHPMAGLPLHLSADGLPVGRHLSILIGLSVDRRPACRGRCRTRLRGRRTTAASRAVERTGAGARLLPPRAAGSGPRPAGAGDGGSLPAHCTALCGDLILLRLRDALAELGPARGRQVHRSWWVAEGSHRVGRARPTAADPGPAQRLARAGQQDLSLTGEGGRLAGMIRIEFSVPAPWGDARRRLGRHYRGEVVGVFSRDAARAAAVAAMGKGLPQHRRRPVDRPSRHRRDRRMPAREFIPEFVIAALRAGKHVFCETPLALELKGRPGDASGSATRRPSAAGRATDALRGGLRAFEARDGSGQARPPVQRHHLAARIPPASRRSRPQGPLRRSLDQAG